MRNKIGEYLVQSGLITPDGLKAALAEQKGTGERLGIVLVRLNLATETQIASALATQLGFPYINLTENPPDPRAVVLIPKEVSVKRAAIAIALEKDLLTVAMSDPLLFSLVQDLESQTGCRIRQVVATRSEIMDAIRSGYPDGSPGPAAHAGSDAIIDSSRSPVTGEKPVSAKTPGRRARGGISGQPAIDADENPETAPIVALADRVVRHAIETEAGDVHVEPTATNVLVRHRLDGLLKTVMELPAEVQEALIARLKTMAGMDAGEKHLPQDGRLRAAADGGHEVDFRVSTLRTVFGEKIVMRALDRRKSAPALEDIGLSPVALEDLRLFLCRQHGIVLVVGPAGSGRTTTLSAALRTFQTERINVITIENPVEYQVPGVNHTQIDERTGLTSASALRAVLRQDPDVIALGEIQDADAARIAIQAAQTGHLVLSTLRSDDAPSSVTRLMEIGAEPAAIASALIGVVAQRLVRRLCIRCRRPYTPPPAILHALNVSHSDAASMSFSEPVGCDQCHHTGYRGRIGLFEVMKVTDRLRRVIASGSAEIQLREAALAGGMTTLGEEGLRKVKAGITTAEEILRVVTELRQARPLCPGCGSAVGVDFVACPRCGRRLGGGCPYCGRSLQPGWRYCPYCARSIDAGPAARRTRDREPGAASEEGATAPAARRGVAGRPRSGKS